MPIYKNQKFLLLVLDTVVSVLTYFIGKYAGATAQDLLFLIGALQPVFAALIISVTVSEAVRELRAFLLSGR